MGHHVLVRWRDGVWTCRCAACAWDGDAPEREKAEKKAWVHVRQKRGYGSVRTEKAAV